MEKQNTFVASKGMQGTYYSWLKNHSQIRIIGFRKSNYPTTLSENNNLSTLGLLESNMRSTPDLKESNTFSFLG